MKDPIPSPKEMSEQVLRDLSPKDRLFIEGLKKEKKKEQRWVKNYF